MVTAEAPAAPVTQSDAPTGAGQGGQQGGLRRVLLCKVPVIAMASVGATDPAEANERLVAALEQGVSAPPAQAVPAEVVALLGRTRLVALPVAPRLATLVTEIAERRFGNDARSAAGWLIFSGLGLALPKIQQPKPVASGPSASRATSASMAAAAGGSGARGALAGMVAPLHAVAQRSPSAVAASALRTAQAGGTGTVLGGVPRATPTAGVAGRSGMAGAAPVVVTPKGAPGGSVGEAAAAKPVARAPRAKAVAAPGAGPAGAEIEAPSGAELQQMREALKISQREVAQAAGLSRGLVAEVERGRRANPMTRLRLSEVLAALARAA
jgi:DNA-binding XRE family transcriptional regulator